MLPYWCVRSSSDCYAAFNLPIPRSPRFGSITAYSWLVNQYFFEKQRRISLTKEQVFNRRAYVIRTRINTQLIWQNLVALWVQSKLLICFSKLSQCILYIFARFNRTLTIFIVLFSQKILIHKPSPYSDSVSLRLHLTA